MNSSKEGQENLKRKVEIGYAGIQTFNQAGAAVLSGFTTIYLIYCGLNDSTIGYVNSLILFISIILQAYFSTFADKHPLTPLKRIIIMLLMISVAAAVFMFSFSLPVAVVIISYTAMSSLYRSGNGLMNSLFVQFLNCGIPANYGLSRAFGSMFHAISAFAVGILVEIFNPNTIMMAFILLALLSICAVALFPKPPFIPEKEKKEEVAEKKKHKFELFSFFQVLKDYPVLLLLVLAFSIQNAGEVPCVNYMIRIVEPLGGNASTVGSCLMLEGLVEVPILFLSSKLLQKRPPSFWLMLSSVAFLLRECSFAFASVLPVVYLGSALNIGCNGLLLFSSVLFIDSIVGPGDKVRAQTTFNVGRMLGTTLGNFAVGLIVEQVGFTFIKHASVVVSAIGMILAAICFTYWKKTIKIPEQTE